MKDSRLHIMLGAALVLPLIAVVPAAAQEPLSAIEWLGQNDAISGPAQIEPPAAEGASVPSISVERLDDPARSDGLVPTSVTGLPVTVWQGGDPQALAQRIRSVPVLGRPAMQTLLYTLLLSEALPAEATGPTDTGPADPVLLARIDRLVDLGAVEPAQAMLAAVGPDRTPDLFARWFDTTLMTGQEDEACAVLLRAPHLAPDYAARIFCTARAGDPVVATVMLDTASALGLVPRQRAMLLDRFLHPEAFEDSALLSAPDQPAPLDFRLHEAIGERLPTQGLPRAFASADLRDVAGWKAQLEAAERLTRTGAMSANAFVGVYTARLPAASGGIWDRVRTFQRFDTALATGSPEAVEKTLPAAWNAMQSAGLQVPFAALFAERLAEIPPANPRIAALTLRIALLSPMYERLGGVLGADRPEDGFLVGLAQGAPDPGLAAGSTQQAIARGFDPDAERPGWVSSGDLGGTILRTMARFDSGARGNPDHLTEAITALRALGLEDTARSASLQLLLLDRQ